MLNPYTQYRQFKLENPTAKRKNTICFQIVLPLIGLIALIWFLIRVIPKPSRATYPCQRVAFPLASSFIIWLIGICGAFSFLKRAQRHLNNKKTLLGLACFVVSVSILWTCLTITSQKQALAADPIPNQPIGDAFDISAEIAVGDAEEIGFNIDGFPVSYDVKEGLLTGGDGSPGGGFSPTETIAKLDPIDGKISFRILVDRSSVEIFANGGRVYMPMKAERDLSNKSQRIYAKGGSANIVKMTVNEIKPIWPK